MENFNFKIQDTDSSLQSKGGYAAFGLNHGYVTNLSHVTDAGKDNTPGEAFDIEVTINEKVFRRRIYAPETSKMFGKSGGEFLEKGDQGYEEALANSLNHAVAMTVHVLKAVGVSQEAIVKKVEKVKPTTYMKYVDAVLTLLPDNYNEEKVDVFLQYEWSIKPGQDRTWLELPKNMKSGYWIVPAQEGEWKEISNEEGLKYINKKGVIHPIEKTAFFMDSASATMQGGKAPVKSLETSGKKTEW